MRSSTDRCAPCNALFNEPPPEGSIAEMAFDAYEETGHFPSCPSFPADDRLDEETERLIVKLVDRAYWEGRNESVRPAINERVQEKYDALRSRIRQLQEIEGKRIAFAFEAESRASLQVEISRLRADRLTERQASALRYITEDTGIPPEELSKEEIEDCLLKLRRISGSGSQ